MSTVKVEKYLKADSKLEIRLDGDEGKYYKSMINGVKNRLLLVTAPYRGKDNLYLHRGDDVEVVLFAQSEKIFFKAKVVDRVQKPIFGYVLEASEEGKRVQLREFVRVKVLLDAELAILPEEATGNSEEEAAPEFQQVIMVDISGGGAGVVTKEPVPENTRVLLKFDLPMKNMKRPMSLVAEVRRCSFLQDTNRYLLGLAFVDLTQRDQDQIIEYVFQKQREQRLMEDGVN